ncbi:hypothetical protein [Streptomyces sp. NPDC126503]|uniref:hypothetical protein n=1 Tax=Streptomyces sp. NPDC126503 TaxID=3155315 RepID=UPI00332788B7
MTQPEPEPLDSDEQAFLDLHEARAFPLADHGRSPARRDIPHLRPINNVLEGL